MDQSVCCCTAPQQCYPRNLLGLNVALRFRWLTWQFVHTPYTIEGYQLIDHSAGTSLQVNDFRKLVLGLLIQVGFTSQKRDNFCPSQHSAIQFKVYWSCSGTSAPGTMLEAKRHNNEILSR